jgi:hypothetical protein
MTENHMSAEPFPLYWPEDWPRSTKRKAGEYRVTLPQARHQLERELRLMGAARVVISTNLALRRDGLPVASASEPTDPGVAVYWLERGALSLSRAPTASDQRAEFRMGPDVERVIACDQWTRVRDNVRAVGLAIAALRALKRSGASQILDRMLVGLNVPRLAAHNPQRTWREVFGWPEAHKPAHEAVHSRYRELSRLRHPDRGGSHEATVELNDAYKRALAELANGATVAP